MTEKQSGPTVLIVGAGTGGLMLALLCEKGNIPYQVTKSTRLLEHLAWSKWSLLKAKVFPPSEPSKKTNLQRYLLFVDVSCLKSPGHCAHSGLQLH